MDTVILASKRKGRDMWEGFGEYTRDEAKAEATYRRSMGRVCKIFPDIIAYKEDVERILDRIYK